MIAYRHIRTVSAVVTQQKQILRKVNERSTEILYQVVVQGRDNIEVMFMGESEDQLAAFKNERLHLIAGWQAWLAENH